MTKPANPMNEPATKLLVLRGCAELNSPTAELPEVIRVAAPDLVENSPAAEIPRLSAILATSAVETAASADCPCCSPTLRTPAVLDNAAADSPALTASFLAPACDDSPTLLVAETTATFLGVEPDASPAADNPLWVLAAMSTGPAIVDPDPCTKTCGLTGAWTTGVRRIRVVATWT